MRYYPYVLGESEGAPGIQQSPHGEGVSSKAARIAHTQSKHAQGMIPHVYFSAFQKERWVLDFLIVF